MSATVVAVHHQSLGLSPAWIGVLGGIVGALLGAIVGWWLTVRSLRDRQLKDDVELAIARTDLALDAMQPSYLLTDPSSDKLESLRRESAVRTARDALAIVKSRNPHQRIRGVANELGQQLWWAHRTATSWYARQLRGEASDRDLNEIHQAQESVQTYLEELRRARKLVMVKKIRPNEGHPGSQVSIVARGVRPLLRRPKTIRVFFDATPASDVQVVSYRKMDVLVPQGTAEASVSIQLPPSAGKTPRDSFWYRLPPLIERIDPPRGRKGVRVTLTGQDLAPNPQVTFGEKKARKTKAEPSGRMVTAKVPRGKGTVQVSVSTAGGSDTCDFSYE